MTTFSEVSRTKLTRLAEGLGLAHVLPQIKPVHDFLLGDWGGLPVGTYPTYPCRIGDDHSPFEYSVAFAPEGIELRLLFETQARISSLHANREAALAFHERLTTHFGLPRDRFQAVRELFLPPEPRPPFTLWHAVIFREGRAPDFKIYLNPRARGRDHANATVFEALRRLGFADGKALIETAAVRKGADAIHYFSLDLAHTADARVKVYFRHDGATAQEVEDVFALASTHRAGDVIEFCETIAGHAGPFSGKPVTSCFAFTSASKGPKAVTFHLPIVHYLRNDARIAERIGTYLERHRLPRDRYLRAVNAYAGRPLADGLGVQSYASFRREASGIRFTAYLCPELYRDRPSRAAFADESSPSSSFYTMP